jgi:hypothetical protein
MTGTATQQKQQRPDRRHQSGTLIGFPRFNTRSDPQQPRTMHPTVPDQKVVNLVDKDERLQWRLLRAQVLHQVYGLVEGGDCGRRRPGSAAPANAQIVEIGDASNVSFFACARGCVVAQRRLPMRAPEHHSCTPADPLRRGISRSCAPGHRGEIAAIGAALWLDLLHVHVRNRL